MSHLFHPPLPIQVRRVAEEVQQITWQGRRHAVRQLLRAWRVEASWWEAPVRRDCYQLLTETGLLVELFHDLDEDAWFLLRLYD